MKLNKKKLVIAVIILVVLIGGFLMIRYLSSVQNYKKAVADISYDHIDPSGIPNGTYIGECDVDFIYAKVEVTVKDGVITSIRLMEHQNDKGSAAEGIEQRIIEEQRIDVDAVSGATNSSKVIKKAVDNALTAASQ